MFLKCIFECKLWAQEPYFVLFLYLLLFNESLDYVDDDDEDDEDDDDDDDDDGLMNDYSSIATSIKFEPGSMTCSNNSNGTNNEFGTAGFSANITSQKLRMNDEININQIENNSGTSIHGSENQNESEGTYI